MRYLSLDLPKPVSKIGLGTWQFGSREWGYGGHYAAVEAARIVERALEVGITLFDTAEIYGLGRSERILGRALRTHSEVAFVATKIFPVLPLAPVVEQRGVRSAQRLGLRWLDLYQVHQPNPLVRDRSTMRGMRALQDVGLVGAVGVSNYSLKRWRAAEDALGRAVLSNQVRYSLVDRRAESDVIPYTEAAGRVVIAYSPLAQGFLSGRYDASTRPSGLVRRQSRLFRSESFERHAALFAVLREVADAHEVSYSQVALAWAIRSENVVAIPGASSVEQVESNAAAADLPLHDDEIRALSDAARAKGAPVRGVPRGT